MPPPHCTPGRRARTEGERFAPSSDLGFLSCLFRTLDALAPVLVRKRDASSSGRGALRLQYWLGGFSGLVRHIPPVPLSMQTRLRAGIITHLRPRGNSGGQPPSPPLDGPLRPLLRDPPQRPYAGQFRPPTQEVLHERGNPLPHDGSPARRRGPRADRPRGAERQEHRQHPRRLQYGQRVALPFNRRTPPVASTAWPRFAGAPGHRVVEETDVRQHVGDRASDPLADVGTCIPPRPRRRPGDNAPSPDRVGRNGLGDGCGLGGPKEGCKVLHRPCRIGPRSRYGVVVGLSRLSESRTCPLAWSSCRPSGARGLRRRYRQALTRRFGGPPALARPAPAPYADRFGPSSHIRNPDPGGPP